VQDPLTTNAVTVEGTLNVLLAARDENVRRVVYASSSSVYGDGGELPRRESAAPNPISPYAVAKLAAERYCSSFTRVYGLETVALRYFNVFGPRQDPTSQYAAVVPRFISAIVEGRPVTIHGNGEQSRDFTYIANVVEANLLAAEAPPASGAVLNIATGRQASVNDLIAAIGTYLEREPQREFEASRAGDVRDSWADLSRARELLGFEPAVSLEDGLKLTIDALVDAGLPVE
jgi:UDP-glucose 4-epimerase